MLLNAIIVITVLSINLSHMKSRKIPLYSWGTTIAIVHLIGGFLSVIFVPIVFILVTICIEIANGFMTKEERVQLDATFNQENIDAEKRIEQAQNSYNELYCLITYTVEQDYDYRQSLKVLENSGIWHYVRGGLITSLLVKHDDAQKACDCIGIEFVDSDA